MKYDTSVLCVFLSLCLIALFASCGEKAETNIGEWNSTAYSYHYRNIDSTEHYARRALLYSENYVDGKAEALNNLAFACGARMDYKHAATLLDSVILLTDNQLELLIAEVQHMRLCQRRSENRAFYEHQEQALQHLKRINEERNTLSERQQRRMIYAESELAIVTSAYYYYVGLERQSIEAMQHIDIATLRSDTAQYLNYLYNVGAGGILTEGSADEISEQEIDMLMLCLKIAQRNNYIYFEANAREALAEHTNDTIQAGKALALFQKFGDIYQIAGAYRTLASCFHAIGDNKRALQYLNLSLADKKIEQAPDLVASIREQLSVVYAALDNKPKSDFNRNIYIDLQEQTRQDRELEARAAMYDHASTQLNWMIVAVTMAILLLTLLLWLFNKWNREKHVGSIYDQMIEQAEEDVAIGRQQLIESERRNLEQRAKVSLVTSIMPLIDRILYSINHQSKDANQQEYIRELTDEIIQRNTLLTNWIQLRQGEVTLRIESFPLQSLFDIMERSRTSFRMKGIRLEIEPTKVVVKADKVLTLFMINTLADNARKFTAADGIVTIKAEELSDSVEISVEDTGCGMDETTLQHVFDHKVASGHGFGLMNCRGIIEKYRKMSQIFSICMLKAESEEGKGSRFFFRLPKGIQRLVTLLLLLMSTTILHLSAHDYLGQAHVYADSAYFSNINGRYEQTLLFADSCRECLNAHYRSITGNGTMTMTKQGDSTGLPAEIQWYHDSLKTNYQIILDIRNESAVAALALHDWNLYAYNNKVYTQLFKEMSADNTLADYCRMMQQSQINKRISIILLILLLMMIGPLYYILYYRHRIMHRLNIEDRKSEQLEMLTDEKRRMELERQNMYVANAVLDNCLSTLKHETMYYPSRIRQLLDSNDTTSLSEVAGYYRELYSILSRQAIAQAERTHLRLQEITIGGHHVRGDKNLTDYLLELLPHSEISAAQSGKYVHITLKLTKEPSPSDYLMCQQIVRDHGEATNLRACGITIEQNIATIILPKIL